MIRVCGSSGPVVLPAMRVTKFLGNLGKADGASIVSPAANSWLAVVRSVGYRRRSAVVDLLSSKNEAFSQVSAPGRIRPRDPLLRRHI